VRQIIMQSGNPLFLPSVHFNSSNVGVQGFAALHACACKNWICNQVIHFLLPSVHSDLSVMLVFRISPLQAYACDGWVFSGPGCIAPGGWYIPTYKSRPHAHVNIPTTYSGRSGCMARGGRYIHLQARCVCRHAAHVNSAQTGARRYTLPTPG
jgi:hypothetical protein